MNLQPSVILATKTDIDSADKFWDRCCNSVSCSSHQFIGFDAESLDIPSRRFSEFFEQFCAIVGQHRPLNRELPPTTIILAWPEDGSVSIENLDRFRDLVLAGANVRLKREPYYHRNDPPTLESFRRDLCEAGLMTMADEPRESSGAMPVAATQNSAGLEFYGNPPFKWGKDDFESLFRQP